MTESLDPKSSRARILELESRLREYEELHGGEPMIHLQESAWDEHRARLRNAEAERDRLREFYEASVACEADDANDETFERLYRARVALDEGSETG